MPKLYKKQRLTGGGGIAPSSAIAPTTYDLTHDEEDELDELEQEVNVLEDEIMHKRSVILYMQLYALRNATRVPLLREIEVLQHEIAAQQARLVRLRARINMVYVVAEARQSSTGITPRSLP